MPDLRELCHLYETADRFAREVGEFRAEVPIPAHNELRYAGHHLLQSLNDEGQVADQEQLRKAKSHCERAMYEAAEAGIMQVLEETEEFRQTYKKLDVSDVVPDFRERILKARRAQKLIVRGRADRESAEQHTSQYMEAFRDLSDSLDVLDASRDGLNAKWEEQDARRRRDVRNTLLAVLGIVVGLLVSVRPTRYFVLVTRFDIRYGLGHGESGHGSPTGSRRGFAARAAVLAAAV